MKILCVCDQGNNRSVTLAGQLKYRGHDVLSCGIKTNSPETLKLLSVWADLIILTEAGQQLPFTPGSGEIILLDIGPDIYPRPYNKELLKRVRSLLAESDL